MIWRDVGRMKEEVKLDELCQDLCPCFEAFMARLRELEFGQEPPYDELKQMFLDTMEELEIDPNSPFGNEQKLCPRFCRFSFLVVHAKKKRCLSKWHSLPRQIIN